MTYKASSDVCIEYQVLAPEGTLRLFLDGHNESSARKAIIPIPKHMVLLTRDYRGIVYISEASPLDTAVAAKK